LVRVSGDRRLVVELIQGEGGGVRDQIARHAELKGVAGVIGVERGRDRLDSGVGRYGNGRSQGSAQGRDIDSAVRADGHPGIAGAQVVDVVGGLGSGADTGDDNWVRPGSVLITGVEGDASDWP